MKTLFSIFILVALTGCVTTYIPTPHNSPMFVKKNEFQAAGGIGIGSTVRTAYSFTDHFGVTASYVYADDRNLNKILDGNQWRTHKVGEFSLGYYTYTKKNLYLDFFAGAGKGEGKADNTITTHGFLFLSGSKDHYKAKVSYNKFFIQSSVGLNRRIIAWNAGIRLSYVDFTRVNVTQNNEQLAFGKLPKPILSYGGEFRISIIKDKLYGSAQVGGILLAPQDEEFVYYDPMTMIVGVLFKL